MLVFLSVVIGVFSLGNAGPLIGNIANARGAAYKVFDIIDRVSKLFIISFFVLVRYSNILIESETFKIEFNLTL